MNEITTTDEAYAAYDEFLDADGTVDVCGYAFYPSRVLLEVDPIAYRCGFNDWADSEDIDTDELTGDLYRH